MRLNAFIKFEGEYVEESEEQKLVIELTDLEGNNINRFIIFNPLINNITSESAYQNAHVYLLDLLSNVGRGFSAEIKNAVRVLLLPSIYRAYFSYYLIREKIVEAQLGHVQIDYSIDFSSLEKRTNICYLYTASHSKLSLIALSRLLKGYKCLPDQIEDKCLKEEAIEEFPSLRAVTLRGPSKDRNRPTIQEGLSSFDSDSSDNNLLIGCALRWHYPALLMQRLRTNKLACILTYCSTGELLNKVDGFSCPIRSRIGGRQFNEKFICFVLSLARTYHKHLLNIFHQFNVNKLIISDFLSPEIIIALSISKQLHVQTIIMAHTPAPILLKRYSNQGVQQAEQDLFGSPESFGTKFPSFVHYPASKYIIPREIPKNIYDGLLDSKPILTTEVEPRLLAGIYMSSNINNENNRTKKSSQYDFGGEEQSRNDKTIKRQIVIASQFRIGRYYSWTYLDQLIKDMYSVSDWAIQSGYSVVIRFRGKHLWVLPRYISCMTKKSIDDCLELVQSSAQEKITLRYPNNANLSVEWSGKQRTYQVLSSKSYQSILCIIGRSSGIILEAHYNKIPVIYLCRNERVDYIVEHKLTCSDFVRLHKTDELAKRDIHDLFTNPDLYRSAIRD